MYSKGLRHIFHISNQLFKYYIPQIVISIIMILLFVKNLIEFNDKLWPDVIGYIHIANSISINNLYHTGMREPFWIWIVKIYLTIFQDPVISIRLLGFTLFILTGFMIYKFVKEYTNSKVAATISISFLFCNNYLIHIAVNCTRDMLILAIMPIICYLTLIKKPHLTNNRRVIYWCIVFIILIGTRMNIVLPSIICLIWSSFRFKINLLKSILPIILSIIFISPYLFYSYNTYQDPFFSMNIHAVWWRNYEFIQLKGTGCISCPSLEEYKNMGMYSGPKTTSFEYIFKMRSLNELFSSIIYGYSGLFILPTVASSYQIGGINIIKMSNGITFNPFYIFYVVGLISCYMSDKKYFIIFPILFLNLIAFTLQLNMDPRLFTPATPFICIIMGIGYSLILNKISLKFNFKNNKPPSIEI
ncbi:glycosyltransferase family 39 protein [Fluviispira multicolorata]|nr:glycosyltransferase family 39 protein [Fluviispira multicolorata]